MSFFKIFFLILGFILLAGLVYFTFIDINIPQAEKNEVVTISIK